jgi:hypothetical protein
MLAQDGAALEKGSAVMAKESCCRVPTSQDAPPSFPGVGGGGGKVEGGTHQRGPSRPVHTAIEPRKGEGGEQGEGGMKSNCYR